MIPITENFQ